MEKVLDLKKTVAELVEENPEVKEIMSQIGFKEITNPVALNVMGRIMTIPRGAAVKGIELSKVIAAFEERGYQVISDDAQSRQGRIRNFIERLSGGEDLDSVRKDFVQEFSHVDAQEIMTAEQTLIKEGMPITEVQRLCDVHSALFHGVASEPPAGALSHDEIHAQAASVNPDDIDALPEGHPLTILRAENTALDALLDTIEGELDGAKRTDVMLQHILALGDVRSHYIKKEELLMPILYDYGVTGPSQVMWGIDDEMKRELAMIIKALKADEETLPMYESRIRALTQRVREMIFKEEKILFPLSLRYFTQMEWYRCYHDLPDMGISFGVPIPAWEAAQPWLDQEAARLAQSQVGGKLQFPTGELSMEQLTTILQLLPVDITFIDKDDVVRFFTNEGQVFTRPLSALGRDVMNCHPPEIIPVVRNLIADFKAKKRTQMIVHRYIRERPIRVQYQAMYDKSGEYIGTVEFVTDHAEPLEKFRR
ncbi:hypothetical protein HMPREF9334_00060 [Selenomonas infelix ATCC 43532]|uniref:Hemerythrin-like domain-containing protein n=1 Tax=Selenomonas infelix ATCC 43532 TaxID=679201 RepID=G5GLD0_9FIRM|nr:DUF438 domain-containing protein [Selenomonas infelix]EHG22675.1 hypothetical protein HMPREF9334_00060 [Selenomonas infelix ATCC 43532]